MMQKCQHCLQLYTHWMVYKHDLIDSSMHTGVFSLYGNYYDKMYHSSVQVLEYSAANHIKLTIHKIHQLRLKGRLNRGTQEVTALLA